MKDVIISSVVPKINYSFSSSIIKYFHIRPLFVGPGVKTGINIQIDHTSTLGSDRLVDAAGAYYTYGGPCLVIDFVQRLPMMLLQRKVFHWWCNCTRHWYRSRCSFFYGSSASRN